AGAARAEHAAQPVERVGGSRERAARQHIDAARGDELELALQRFGKSGAIGDAAGARIAVNAVLHRQLPLADSCRWQATRLPGAISMSFGASTLQRGITWGQRVWKAQPGGGLTGLGTSPCSTRLRRLIFGSGIGTAASSASV